MSHEMRALSTYQDLYELIRTMSDKIDEIREHLSSRHKSHLTVQEIAHALGRTDYTIRRYIAAGVIDAVRIGPGAKGRLAVPREQLQRLVAHGRAGRMPAVMMPD